MTIFTANEQKNLEKLLKTASDQGTVMTLEELHGYLSGITIIPEMLMPSQWIPSIFGGEDMCEIDDEKEGERLIGSLLTAYNRINLNNRHGEIIFPFAIKKVSEDDIFRIRKWSHGFFVALSKSKKIFQKYDKGRTDSGEAKINSETFAVCYCILRAVAFPDKTPEFLERIQKESSDDVSQVLSESKFISMLPDAVTSIHEYAIAVQAAETQTSIPISTIPLQVAKIGRNDPCKCGSGIKYKKCCGK